MGWLDKYSDEGDARKRTKLDKLAVPTDEEVIKRQAFAESSFDPKKVSPKGAIGLFQVLPDTYGDYKKKTKDKGPISRLKDPKHSFAVRNWYMDDLGNSTMIKDKPHGRVVAEAKKLAAYNWGRGDLSKYLSSQKDSGVDIYHSLDWVQGLPRETRDYLGRVLFRNDPKFEVDYLKAIHSNPQATELDSYEEGGQIPWQKDPEFLFKDKYNTKLNKQEEREFNKWVKSESSRQGRDILMDMGAYDIKGFWKSGDYKNRDDDNHGSDRWKKPNHPTFSKESTYHGAEGFYGGEWGEDGSYHPSRQTRQLYDPEYYKSLFGREPHRPEHLNLSKSTNFTPSIFANGGDLTAKRDITNINPLSIISKEDLEEYYRTQSGEPSYQQFRLNRSKAEEIQRQNQNLMSKGQTKLGNAITDLGTGILTWGTEFRPPTDYELERNRYSADKGFFGTQYNRAQSIARAGSWGLADIMTGASMSGVGKPNRFATSFIPSKHVNEVVDIPEDILKGLAEKHRTSLEPIELLYREQALNKKILNNADDYLKAISSNANRARLKEFDEIYDTRLSQRLDPWIDIMENATQIGKSSKIQIGPPTSFTRDELGINTINWSPKDPKTVFNTPSGKFDDLPVTKNTRTSILNPKLHEEDIPTVVWHELSHDFNDVGNFFYPHTDMNKIFLLDHDLEKIFKTFSKINLKDAAEAKNAYVYKTYSSGNIPLDYTDVPIEDIIKRESEYITRPTETWAFLSTNLKQDLVREGYIKNYLDPIDKSILEKAKKGKNTIYSRFEPYIEDEDQFIKMFNRMGLGTIPAALGARTLVNKDNKFEDGGRLDYTIKSGLLKKSSKLSNFTQESGWLDKYK